MFVNRKLILITLFTCSFSIFAHTQATVIVNGDKIIYTGYLGKSSNAKLYELYNKNPRKISTIEFESPGGDANLGMDVGEFIIKNKLDVRVNKLCLSSCANYIFPAAVHKYLSSAALLGYHGGPSTMSPTQLSRKTRSKLASLSDQDRNKIIDKIKYTLKNTQNRESDYFKQIGVNIKITSLGVNSLKKSNDKRNFEGWFYSIKDLKKFGVKNISVDGGVWHPNIRDSRYVIVPEKSNIKYIPGKYRFKQLEVN